MRTLFAHKPTNYSLLCIHQHLKGNTFKEQHVYLGKQFHRSFKERSSFEINKPTQILFNSCQ